MAEVLEAYLREQAQHAYSYGYHDCATFGIGWVDILRGTDHAATWHQNYTTSRGCKRFIARGGGMQACIGRFLRERHGIETSTRDLPGHSIVCAEAGGITATGIRVGNTMIAFRGEKGIVMTTGARVLCEWAI